MIVVQKKPGRPQEKISLHPLSFKEALGDLMKVKPEQEPKKSKKPTGKRRAGTQGKLA